MSHTIPPNASSGTHPIDLPQEETEENRLHPPHFFHSNPIEHLYIAHRSLQEASRLYQQHDPESDPASLNPRVKALLSRARFHQILAEEAVPQNDTAESITAVQPLSHEELSIPTPHTPHSTNTAQSRASKRFEKLKNQRLEKAAYYETKAADYKREANFNTRFAQTIREGGPQYHEKVKEIETKIQELKANEEYCTMRARYWEDLAYGNDTSFPGAYHQSPVGNYQDEYPVRANSPTVKAKKAPHYSQFDSLPRAQTHQADPPQAIKITRSHSNKRPVKATPATKVEVEGYIPPDVTVTTARRSDV
ncbi:MAG: hypothetical protein ACOYK6_05445 [Chthoniobacterales bacterium]